MSRIQRFLRRSLGVALVIGSGGAPDAGFAKDLEAFALCIGDSGAVFYGAHWCPHCARQRAAFGAASDRLPYTECYEAGTRQRRAVCEHVGRFPTWEFGDGTVRAGFLSLEKLAALTGCSLP